jgi:predicted transcriptional regulator
MSNYTGSYTTDMAEMIDTPEEIAADEYGVSLSVAARILADRDNAVRAAQAQTLGAIIGHLIGGSNLIAKVHCLALAIGLDQLNGFHSQSEVARQLGVTRALISHYVIGWRDVLSGGIGNFDCTKYRKRNATRATYASKATNPVLQAKRNQAIKQSIKARNTPPMPPNTKTK